MKTKAITMALAAMFSLQMSLLPLPSSAETVNYTPVAGHTAGLLEGQAQVTRVSDLNLAGAMASFQGNSFQIKKENSATPALYGVMMNPDLSTSGKRAKFRATAFLQGGDALAQLPNSGTPDTILLKDSTQVDGTIQTIDSNKVVVGTNGGTKEIDIKSIANIDSPRMATLAVVAQAKSTIEPGQPFIADASMQMDMNGGAQCAPKHHKARQVHTMPATKTWTTTSTSTSTSTSTRQVPLPATVENPPACPTTVVEGTVQPAVVERVPVRPILARCRNNYAWLGGLLVAGGIATAIAVPIACHHHHSNAFRDEVYRQQTLLLLTPATP